MAKVLADSYEEGLENVVSRVTDEVYLEDIKLSKQTFETLVKASAQSKAVSFQYCTIEDSTEFDFSGPIDVK